MKHEVRRIRVLSVAKIAFFIYWALGIVMAMIYGALFAMMSALDPSSIDPELGGITSIVSGMGAIMVMLVGLFLSVVYGVMAAIAIAVAAAGYNLLARIIGGVEVDLVPSGASPSAGPPLSSRAPDRPANSDSDVVWTPVSRSVEPSQTTQNLPPVPDSAPFPMRSSELPAPSSMHSVESPASSSGYTPPPATPRSSDSFPKSSEQEDPDSRWKPPAGS